MYASVAENLLTTSGLSILSHGIISLPDATSCDKYVGISPLHLSASLYVCLLVHYLGFTHYKKNLWLQLSYMTLKSNANLFSFL